jgi:hypothetical protein
LPQPEMPMPTCEVCAKNQAIGVCSVPGVAYSAAYCAECLKANAHPLFILVAGTACNGGLDHCASWWKEMVTDTLKHLGRTEEEFTAQVNEEIRQEIQQMDEGEQT